RRAPDHSLGNQTGASWPQGLHGALQLFSNISRPMRASSEVGHRSEIFFFAGRETIKANAKEALIESRYCLVRCMDDILPIDGALRRGVPGMLAPFLQKVRIALCFVEN